MPTENKFSAYAPTPETSPTSMAAITPHDTDTFAFVSRYIYVGTGGVLQIVPLSNEASDTAVEITVGDGQIVWIQAVKVKATDTTASNIVIFA